MSEREREWEQERRKFDDENALLRRRLDDAENQRAALEGQVAALKASRATTGDFELSIDETEDPILLNREVTQGLVERKGEE